MTAEWNIRQIEVPLKSYMEERLEECGQLISNSAKTNCPVGKYEDDNIHGYWSTITKAMNKPGRTKGSISWATIKTQSTVDTPAIQEDAVAIPDGENKVWIGSSYPVMWFLELGTIAHDITAKVAKILKWVSGGTTYFAAKVSHPGTEPNPILRRALLDNTVKIGAIFNREING